MANEATNVEILGKDSRDDYVFVHILTENTTRGKAYLFTTEGGMFYLSKSSKIYGSGSKFRGGGVSAENLECGDRILSYNLLEFGNISEQLAHSLVSQKTILSYLCGFQTALITKFRDEYDLNPLLPDSKYRSVSKYFTQIQFLDIERESSVAYAHTKNDNLLGMLIQYHKEINLFSNALKIQNQIYQDFSYYLKTGIIKCSIVPNEITKGCIDTNIPFFPQFCRNFRINLRFFLIGFLTGFFWDGKIEYNREKSRFPRIKTDGEINIPTKVSIGFNQNDVIERYLGRMLSIFGFQVSYKYSEIMNKNLISFTTMGLANLLKNNPILNQSKWATVIHKSELDSEIISFEAETNDSLWRPIIDYTVTEAN